MSLAGLGKTTILAAIVVGIVGSVSAQENWPRFRGENGAGTGSQAGLPDQWSEKDYAWTVDIPGKGHSSPIVWGEKLFPDDSDSRRGDGRNASPTPMP